MQSQPSAEAAPVDEINSALGVSYDEIIGLTSGTEPQTEAVEEGTEEVEKAQEEAPAEEEEEKKEAAPEEKKPEAKEKSKAEAKSGVLTAKTADGKTIELAPDTKLTKKVDGVEREVSIKEALDHYAFDVNYTRKFQEVSEQKKTAETQLQSVREKEEKVNRSLKLVGTALSDTTESLAKGDIDGFLRKFADLTQVAPSKLRSALRGHFVPEVKKWLEADEAERTMIDAQELQKEVTEEHKTIESKRATEAKVARYQGYAMQKIQEAGVSPEDWVAAERMVIREYLNGVPPVMADCEPFQVQQYVEAVTLHAQLAKQDSSVHAVIEKAVPGLNEKDAEAYQEVKKTIAPFLQELEEEEIIELIKKVVAKESPDKEEEKIEVLDDKAKSPRKKDTSTGSPKEAEDWNPLSVYED